MIASCIQPHCFLHYLSFLEDPLILLPLFHILMRTFLVYSLSISQVTYRTNQSMITVAFLGVICNQKNQITFVKMSVSVHGLNFKDTQSTVKIIDLHQICNIILSLKYRIIVIIFFLAIYVPVTRTASGLMGSI